MPETRSSRGALSTFDVSSPQSLVGSLCAAPGAKRRRDPLAESSYQQLRSPSRRPNYFLDTRALRQPCAEIHKQFWQRASTASSASRELQYFALEQEELTRRESTSERSSTEIRNAAIFHVYLSLGRPPASEWSGRGGTVAIIADNLNIPNNSTNLVKKVLSDIDALADPADYDPGAGLRHGRKVAIKEGSAEANLICNALECGVGRNEAAVMVNSLRELQDRRPVSWSSVQAFAVRSATILTAKRGTKKSGKDEGSDWAEARLNQTKQMRDQFDESRPLPLGCARASIEGCFWVDEHHEDCRLGHASKWENRVSRHPGGPADMYL